MSHTITLEEAKVHLEDLIAEAGRGVKVPITDNSGQTLAALGPASPESGHASLIGLMKGQIELLPGWDEPREDFKPYME
jgi:antitoxin (DNA-binding transcriptional repressor) of toxin-antitoxin stability system